MLFRRFLPPFSIQNLDMTLYTGVLQRRRRSWTAHAFPFFVLWWVLRFVSFAALIITDYTELDYSRFPPEVLNISGAPATPTHDQQLQSITPAATAQAILARAARAANRNRRAAQPTARLTTNTTAPTRPTATPSQAAIPAGATTFSDSEEA